ncbi:hypothetical protein ABZU25_08670 [Micromonospora sp. NPDC005215]|uniref:hypothetical protein n=1 Tax=Micromonospora sp. NPDC005215 TaxID=3157024 RepID=UPI0033B2C589
MTLRYIARQQPSQPAALPAPRCQPAPRRIEPVWVLSFRQSRRCRGTVTVVVTVR